MLLVLILRKRKVQKKEEEVSLFVPAHLTIPYVLRVPSAMDAESLIITDPRILCC